MSRIRCFVAAGLPGSTREQLADLQGRLKAAGLAARWVRPEGIHLTLKFLGELSPGSFDRVVEQLKRPLDAFGILKLTPRGVATFPPGPRARVIWAGLAGDLDSLSRLALEIESRAEQCGIEKEHRAFRPHLTLGRSTRLRGLGDVSAILQAESGFEGVPFAVRELVLYESRLRSHGASYVPRLTLPLSADPYPS